MRPFTLPLFFPLSLLLLLLLLVLFTTPVLSTSTYDLDDAWCIWQENGISNSYAIVIPKDGSAEEDGIDPKCKCGGLFKQKLRAKGAAITEWQCHYGPANTACITFNLPLLFGHLSRYIYPIYKEVTGLDLDCENVGVEGHPGDGNVVCPYLFPGGKNARC